MLLNPFEMNDWRISATLKASLALYVITWALIGLDALGLHVPIVRELFAIVSLLYIPGILILRVFCAHQLGSARTVLFAVGLSVATVMFTGLFINVAYPLVGVEWPFAVVPAVGTMSAVAALLAAASYWRDRNFGDDPRISARQAINPPVLLLCLLPFVIVLGSFVMNTYHSNVVLLGALIAIGATAFWVGASASFPERLHPFAVFAIALALLYYGSLVSSYIWGWDIQMELYHANLVLTNGVWNLALPGSTNGVISVTMLAPLLALTSGMSVTWLFKLVYPLLFSLVPLCLFIVVQKQTNDKVAFLAAFFVSSLFTFFGEMPALARQEIAELFLVLLLVVTVDKLRSAEDKQRVYALYAIFTISLVVSHYALAFIYLVYVIIAWLLLFLVDNPALGRLDRPIEGAPKDHLAKPHRMLTLVFVLAFTAFTVAWYISVGAAASTPISIVFTKLVYTIFTPRAITIAAGIGIAVYLGALALIYLIISRRPQESRWGWYRSVAPVIFFAALGITALNSWSASLNDILQIGTLSPLHEVGRSLYLVSVCLITLGLCALVFRRCRLNFDKEFIALALASFAVLIAAAIVPQLAFIINTTRLFHVSTLLLAPFCVIGALLAVRSVARVVRRRDKTSIRLAQKVVAVFFVAFFFFGTGFIYEVTHQESTSFILNGSIDAPRFNVREVTAGQWLFAVRGSDRNGHALAIYADAHRRALLLGFDLNNSAGLLRQPPTQTPPNGYIYLGTYNVETEQVAQVTKMTFLQGAVISYADVNNTIATRSKVFDDGGATVYYRPS